MLRLLSNAIMLQRLRHAILGRPRPRPKRAQVRGAGAPVRRLDSQQATQRLNALAPIKPAAAAREAIDAPQSFINREALLNRSERIAAYEFSLSRDLHSRFSLERARVRSLYDDLLVRSLAKVGIERVLGHRLAVLHLAAAHMMQAPFAGLPAKNTVLMLDPTAAERNDPACIGRALAAGRACGYRVGLHVRHATGLSPEQATCDWIQIETPEFDGIELSRLVEQLRAAPRTAREPLSIVAANLATLDDFRHCFRLAVDFFQGPFVTSREKWQPPKSEIDRSRVILVLNKLRAGEASTVLADLIQEDPVMTYKFLRFINSAAMGLQSTIDSVLQGLMLLGQSQFYRWLSLLLFDVKSPSFVERSLTEQALVRARFMELLGADPASADALFLTGLFSLLDQMMGQPIETMLAQFTVLPSVKEALLARTGPFAAALELAIAFESRDNGRVDALAEQCGFTADFVNTAQIEAIGFATQVTSAID